MRQFSVKGNRYSSKDLGLYDAGFIEGEQTEEAIVCLLSLTFNSSYEVKTNFLTLNKFIISENKFEISNL